mgnify:CR=1 FL=1
MSRKTFTDEQEREIVRRYEEGENTVLIGKDVLPHRVCNSRTILNVLERRGVTKRPSGTMNNPKITQAQRDEAVRLCREGLTREEAAARVGVHFNTVQKALNAAGVSLAIGNVQGAEVRAKRARTQPVPDGVKQAILAQYKTGLSTRQLEPIYGIRFTTISAIVRELDPSLPPQRVKFRTEESIRQKARARLLDPKQRLRKLLQTARATSKLTERDFDDQLFEIYWTTIPERCACCDIKLDYKKIPSRRTASDRPPSSDRSPSFDRVINTNGYTVKNVKVVCWRCNRLKTDASLDELRMLLNYVERYSK